MWAICERVEELRNLRRYEPRSLKDFCLQSIARNISLYNAAFDNSRDANLRRNLQFLKRRYSSYLISKVSREYRLDESYWNFLINEHLEELDFRMLSEGNRNVLLSRIAEVGHGLQKVVFRFSGRCFDRPTITFVKDVLRKIPNVKELKFEFCCDIETLKMLPSSCPDLKVLAIVGYPTERELESLFQEEKNTVEEGGQGARSARVGRYDYLDEGITFLLRSMPLLEDVLYPRLQDILYRLHKHEMENNTLQKRYNLTALGVFFPTTDCARDVADKLTLLIDVCPHLKTLELFLANNDSNLMLVSRLAELADLTIFENDFTNHAFFENKPYLNQLLKLRGGMLRRLSLNRYYISIDVLVQSCRALEKLSLNEVEFVPLDRNVTLEPLRNLRSLSIEQMIFRDDRINQQSLLDILKCCPNLEALHFGYCQFGNFDDISDEISELFKNSVLQRLRFNSCHEEDELLLPIISTCSTLTEIFVEDGYMLKFD